jgi:hypothetical protein
MKKSILSKLGGKKDDKSPSKTSQRTDGPLKNLDAASIRGRYLNFAKVCDDVGEYPSYGAQLLQCIIEDIKLFTYYIDTFKDLQKLVGLCGQHIDPIIQHLKSDPDCERRFLTGVDTLAETNAYFKQRKGTQYQDDLVKHAFSNQRIYKRLLNSEDALEKALNSFPALQNAILNILKNDIAILNECLGRLPFFCEFCKNHAAYKEHFVNLAYTNEQVFNQLRLYIEHQFAEFIASFPEAEDPIIKYICANVKFFNITFGTFTSLYDFCHEYPQFAQHLETIFDKAISMNEYVKRNISSINRLVEIYNHNPAHAERLESMVLVDPKWVLEMIHFSEDIQTLSNHKAFSRLKAAFFSIFYSDLINFRGFAGTEAKLQKLISYCPDQEFKLRLYYQLHMQKKSVAEIFKTQYQDPATLLELKQHIQNCTRQGSMPRETLKGLREQINGILDFTEDSVAYYPALSELKEAIDYALAPKVAALLHKGTLSEVGSLKDSKDSEQTPKPDSPERLTHK